MKEGVNVKLKNKKIQVITLMMAMTFASTIATDFNSIQVQAETMTEFKDLTKEHAYYDVISEMVEKGIIKGYEDGTFKPNDYISRQHAAVLINRAVNLPEIENELTFDDVPKTHPYYSEIQKVASILQKSGLLPGDKKTFDPEQPLTRGEMALILAVAFKLDKTNSNFVFSDIKDTAYEEYVMALYANGVTTGYEDNTFRPQESLSRMHFALFMHRAMNVKKAEVIQEEIKEIQEEPKLSDYVVNYKDEDIAERLMKVKMEYADVFDQDLPMRAPLIEANPISLKIYEEGLDILRQYDMKIYDNSNHGYHSGISVTMKGYQNPVQRIGNRLLGFNGHGEDKGKIVFDYRIEETEIVAQHWLKIAFPTLSDSLSPLLKEKAEGARENQDDPAYSNIEILYIDGYEIQIGVNTLKEEFILHIREPMQID